MDINVQGNDVLYNYFPNFKLKKDFETYNEKTNSLKKMKMYHYTSQTNSEPLIMKPITLVAV